MEKIYRSFCLTIALLILGFAWSRANILNETDALQRAYNDNKNSTYLSSLIKNAQTPAKHTWTDRYGKPTLYVFSTKGTKPGFVLVSADDQAISLIGYSDRDYSGDISRYDSNTANSVFNISQFNEYSDEIEWLRYLIKTANRPPVLSFPTFAAIAPYIKTSWGQREPYNDLCPVVNGTHCLTGCTPTAFSQLMKYYNWPARGNGSHSYQPFAGKTLSLDFSTITFDWSRMLKDYTATTATDAQKKAVATLEYAVGVSLNVKYGTEGSGGSIEEGAMALYKYFNYQGSIKIVKRRFYQMSQWYAMLYNELRSNGPIIFSMPGHAYICDGFENGFFHFNWGWGGMLNGYFLTTAIKYNYLPTKEEYEQNMIIGVRPNDGKSQIPFKPYFEAEGLSIAESSVSLGSLCEAHGNFRNCTIRTLNFKFALKATSTDKKAIYLECSQDCQLESNHYYQKLHVRIPRDIPAGVYALTPVLNYQNRWYNMALNPSGRSKAFMVVADSRATFFDNQKSAENFYNSRR